MDGLTTFIFNLHDDVLGVIPKVFSEQVHAADMLAVSIDTEDEGEKITAHEFKAFYGFIGYPVIIHITSVVCDK